MKLNIVYLITHKERLKCNNPPYYYIGSKYQWEGEGTYYGSPSDPTLRDADKNYLKFEILAVLDCNCKLALAAIERQYQEKYDAVYSLEYFNKAYANSGFWKEESRAKAILKFKHKANSLSPDGVAWKYVWAAKSNRDFSEEEKSIIRSKRKKALDKKLPNGLTVAQDAANRSHAKLREVGEDGKTGYERQAEKLKITLSQIGEDGLTLAQRRAKHKFKAVTVGGLSFESLKEAKEVLGVDEHTLNHLQNGVIYQKTYDKLLAKYGEEFVTQFQLLPHKRTSGCDIEGLKFPSSAVAAKELGVGISSISDYRTKGVISRTLKIALETYNSAEKD